MLTLPYIISQAFTIIMYALLVPTYYVKDRKKVLILDFLSIIANCLAYIFLNAWTGLVMCSVSLVRNITFFISTEKRKKDKNTSNDVVILLLLYLLSALLTILTYSGPSSLFPAFATAIYTYALWQKNIKTYKLLGVPNSILWILYNIHIKSIFGIILETILLICSTIGYLLERKKKINKKVI